MEFDRIFKDVFPNERMRWIAAAAVAAAGIGIAWHVSTTAGDDFGTVEASAAKEPPLVRFKPSAAHRTLGTNVLTVDGRPTHPSNPASLARALQAGLAQAECYDGPINGIWNVKSKDSMRRFIAAVNAQLPVNTPDPSLLALVKSNSSMKCVDGQSAPDAEFAAPPLISVGPQRSGPTRPDAAAPPPSSVSPPPDANKGSVATIEPVSSASETTVPSNEKRSDAGSAEPSNELQSPPDRQTKSQPVTQQSNNVRRRQTRRRKQTTLGDVSRFLNKNVKSIQRSIESFF
jgi:hypothetical protein